MTSPLTSCCSSKPNSEHTLTLWKPGPRGSPFSIDSSQVAGNPHLFRVVKSWQEYSPKPGDQFPLGPRRYEILQRVGGGASKDVFVAKCIENDFKDTTLPEKVAVVFWRIGSDRDVDKVDSEEKALARVEQIPGTLRVLDSPKRIGQTAVRMITIYCDGGTLTSWAEGKPVVVRLQIALQIACIVKALHKEGIAHGDLKPSNIGINNSQPVLLDWGSSTSDGGNSELEVANTLAYAPPYGKEKRNNTPVQSDVFALGALLFEAMGGSFAEGSLAVEVAKSTGRDRNPIAYRFCTTQEEIDLVVAQIPSPMRELLLSMLRLDPHERITIEEVVNKLPPIIEAIPSDFYGIPDLGRQVQGLSFCSSDRSDFSDR